SFGAIKGREAAAWQIEVASKEPVDLVEHVVYRGFDGLLVDTRGFPSTKEGNKGDAIIKKIKDKYAALVQARTGQRNAKLPLIPHDADGRQVFLDLRPYRDELRALDPAYFEAKVREECEWVAVIWLNGFCGSEDPAEYNRLRY